MRKRTLTLIFLIAFVQILRAQEPKPSIATLNFDAGVDGDCSVKVNAADTNPDSAPMQMLMIFCRGKKILSYPTEDSLIDMFLNYPHDDRIFTRWEGGSHVRFAVFRVSSHLSTGTVVFDKQLIGTPDVVNTPDVLLVHNGKRWLEGRDASLPTSTDVYRWTGEQYLLTESWKWNKTMRYEDRFCVIDPKKLSCPVTPIPIK